MNSIAELGALYVRFMAEVKDDRDDIAFTTAHDIVTTFPNDAVMRLPVDFFKAVSGIAASPPIEHSLNEPAISALTIAVSEHRLIEIRAALATPANQ